MNKDQELLDIIPSSCTYNWLMRKAKDRMTEPEFKSAFGNLFKNGSITYKEGVIEKSQKGA